MPTVQATKHGPFAVPCVRRAPARAGHVPYFQVFQHHHRVVFAEDGADLVQYVLANRRDRLMQPRDFGLLLLPVSRELHFVRELSLLPRQPLLQIPISRHRQEHGAIGQREQVPHAPIAADGGGGWRRRVRDFLSGLYGDSPVTARPADGDIADFAADDAGPAELHPANTRQENTGEHLPAIFVPWPQIDSGLLRIGIAQAVVPPLLPEHRESPGAAFVKGILERPVQKLQHLLLGVDGDSDRKPKDSPFRQVVRHLAMST